MVYKIEKPLIKNDEMFFEVKNKDDIVILSFKGEIKRNINNDDEMSVLLKTLKTNSLIFIDNISFSPSIEDVVAKQIARSAIAFFCDNFKKVHECEYVLVSRVNGFFNVNFYTKLNFKPLCINEHMYFYRKM